MFNIEKFTQWQFYAYYVLLTIIVFVAHHFSDFLEQMVVAGNQLGWAYLFVWYLGWFIVGGEIILFLLETTGWER